MTAITAITATCRIRPTATERMLLRAGRTLQLLAMARMTRRARTVDAHTENARRAADERRRTAQALGAFGIPPR